MKNFSLFLILVCFFFSSCKEEAERGQYSLESVPPGEVKSPTVENLPGAAIISYIIPDDEDLLYVKATFTLDNGEVVEQKASAYASSLKIEGIGKSREVEVSLVAGDRSKNESKPITVKTHPLDAPIYTVFKTLKIGADFGGVKILWDNLSESEVVVTVTTPDAFGNLVLADNFYSKSKIGQGFIRGYPSVERLFAVSLRDRWGNVTDTIKQSYTPFYEERIQPKDKFRKWNPLGIPYKEYAPSYGIQKIWDDTPGTLSRYLYFVTTFPDSFTFDMGQTAIFSRFKVMLDASQGFGGQNVMEFELWGAPTTDVSADFSKGWFKLGSYKFRRPTDFGGSGLENTALLAAGEDFPVDPNAPPVRYIRFVTKSTWGASQYATLAELQFWGQVK